MLVQNVVYFFSDCEKSYVGCIAMVTGKLTER